MTITTVIVLSCCLSQQPERREAGRKDSSDESSFAHDVHFAELGPRTISQADIRKHGWKWAVPRIDLEKESFTVYVPKARDNKSPLGLLVYMSPSPQGFMVSNNMRPAKLIEVLDKHRLAYVGANEAPNDRNPMDRLQLALTAVHGMKGQCDIDEKRIIVAGLSGGGKMAGIAGRFAPDLFAGAMAICGPSFHRGVPAGRRGSYPADMVLTRAGEKEAADRVRFVFITGSNDFNRQPTIAIEAAYRKSGFQTLLVDENGLGHTIPDAETLDRCLQFVLAGVGSSRRSPRK